MDWILEEDFEFLEGLERKQKCVEPGRMRPTLLCLFSRSGLWKGPAVKDPPYVPPEKGGSLNILLPCLVSCGAGLGPQISRDCVDLTLTISKAPQDQRAAQCSGLCQSPRVSTLDPREGYSSPLLPPSNSQV